MKCNDSELFINRNVVRGTLWCNGKLNTYLDLKINANFKFLVA